jgi:hypothetical protein
MISIQIARMVLFVSDIANSVCWFSLGERGVGEVK